MLEGVWTARLRPLSPSERLAVGEADLIHHEDRFLQRLATTQSAAAPWLRPRLCGHLARLALTLDRPASLTAMRRMAQEQSCTACLPAFARSDRALGEAGWRRRLPGVALYHVLGGRAHAEAYAVRFPQAAQQWQKLVEAGLLPAAAYLRAFGIAPDICRTWQSKGLLPAAELAQVVQQRMPLALQCLQAGLLAPAALWRRLVSQADRERWALFFAQHHMALPSALTQQLPWLAHFLLQRVCSGELTAEQLLSWVPRPSAEAWEALQQAGRSSPWIAARAGKFDAVALEEAMAQHNWQPAQLAASCPLPPALAERWLQAGRIDAQPYASQCVQLWHVPDALPAPACQWAAQASDPVVLYAQARLPPPGTRRHAFALRLLATHLQYRATPPAPAASLAKASHCSICLEAFGEALQPHSATLCGHGPTVCCACVRDHVHFAGHTCPEAYCGAPLLPNDIHAAGGTPQQVERLCRTVIHTHLSTRPTFLACPHTGCPGGTAAPLAVGSQAPCPVCGTPIEPVTNGVVWQRDGQLIARLVHSLAAQQGAQRPVRECPGVDCGAPTEHTGGCSTMHCRHCQLRWDFNEGPSIAYMQYGPHLQRYVPHAGLLQRAGLYTGFAPGATGVANLASTLAQRLRARQAGVLQLMPPP